MTDMGWRARLVEALADRDRAMRDVSIAVGRNPGYVNSLLNEGREPRLSNLVAVCDELNISVSWLLFGVEMDKSAEQLLKIYSSLAPDQRAQFLRLAESITAVAGRKDE